jgi:hypothetical protein
MFFKGFCCLASSEPLLVGEYLALFYIIALAKLLLENPKESFSQGQLCFNRNNERRG